MAEKEHGPFFGALTIDLTGFGGDFTITPSRNSELGITVFVVGYPRSAVRGVKAEERKGTLFVTEEGSMSVSGTGNASVSGGGIANTGVMGNVPLPKRRWGRVKVRRTGDASVSGGGIANTGIILGGSTGKPTRAVVKSGKTVDRDGKRSPVKVQIVAPTGTIVLY